MEKRFLVICLCLLFTGLMGNSTVSHGALSYRVDVLEQGNPGGWEESLKTFDNEVTVTPPETVEIDVWLHDVPEPLITAGFWVESDTSQMRIISADIYSEPWDAGMSQTVKDPKDPGTFMVRVGNLSTVLPDSEDNIIIAKVQLQCISSDDTVITLTPIPGFDTVVGDSAGVYDLDIMPHTITIHPTGGVNTNCDDGIACTVDSSGPDDQCSNIPDDALCDDGLFCNGTETCDLLSGCQPGSAPCDQPDECDEETDECINTGDPKPPEGDLGLSFRLIPQAHLRSHWIPLPIFMFIVSEDEETRFDEMTTVAFAGEDSVTSPVIMVLSEKLVYVFSLIRAAGLGPGGIAEIGVTVVTAEGEGTEILHLITLPFL